MGAIDVVAQAAKEVAKAVPKQRPGIPKEIVILIRIMLR